MESCNSKWKKTSHPTTMHLLLNHIHGHMMIPIIIFTFLKTPPPATALSFNFTSFAYGDEAMVYKGDALPVSPVIELTKSSYNAAWNGSVGRATYFKPLHLWDAATRNLTDFATNFSFVIQSRNRATNYGDGLALFFAPNGSIEPPPDSGGGGLGLRLIDNSTTTADDRRYVAVEFDTYNNTYNFPFDPPYEHVGIDINSTRSATTVRWYSSASVGAKHEAWITYNSTTHVLSVVFSRDGIIRGNLSHVVNLMDHLPEWVTFGFSAATGTSLATHSITSWNFSSTLEDSVDDPVTVSPPSGNKALLAVGLGVGAALVVIVALVWLVITRRRSRKKNRGEEEGDDGIELDDYMDDEFLKETGPKKFSYHELAQATNNFENKLGEGGFGGVYKGFLRDVNEYVAVKRVSRGSKQGTKEYAAEVRIIGRLRHRNLVRLNGWCHERKELLLVYEFLSNGSLDSHLFQENSLLTWDVRYKIAKGLASGLLYLHEEWEQCVVHRDIKSSNIMLDSNFNAKLGDFGLARLVDHLKGSQTTVLAGTMGYMAPECSTTGKASKESDVYSFGVVALEIACGRKPINPRAIEGQVQLVPWVWDLYGSGKLLEAIDPRLCGDFDEHQMQRLMIVGLWCAHPDEKLRPSIRQATHVLNFEAPLPILPSKMPIPTYFAPPIDPSLLLYSYGSNVSETTQKQSSSHSYNTNSSQFTNSSTSNSLQSTSLLHTR